MRSCGSRARASRAGCAARRASRSIEGHARFEAPRTVRVGDELLEAQRDLHQRRRAGARAGPCPGSTQSTTSPTRIDDGRRLSARAPGRRRRQLHRARVRADVPALRQPRHRRRDGPAAGRARGRGRRRRRSRRSSKREGIAIRLEREVHHASRRSAARHRGRRSTAQAARREIDGLASAARGRPPAEHRRPRPRQGRRRDRRARLHHGGRRATHQRRRASGRSATATAAARSRTPRTTTTRSSRRTCSTAIRAASTDRIPAYALFIDPPLGRVGMTEREVRADGRRALVATLPMSRVGRAKERSETQGFMKFWSTQGASGSSGPRSSVSRATK